MSGIVEVLNLASGAALTAVLNSLWQAAALAGAVWMALKLLPRTNAATRHMVWWVALLAVALLPLAPGIVRSLKPGSRPAEQSEPAAVAPGRAAADAEPVAYRLPARSPAVPQGALEIHAGDWSLWILAAWSAVVLLQVGRMVWSYRYLSGLKERARPASPEMRRDFDAWMMSCRVGRPARVLVSKEIRSPIAAGFRQPAVILPEVLLEEFQPSELDHVLLHELAHIARRDDWSNLAARAMGGLLALHPAGVWILRRIEREREMACDDWVVAMTGSARPYAASLARLFELCFTRRRMLLASGMAERPSHLGERIEMLLHRTQEFRPKASARQLAVMGVALVALVMAGGAVPRWLVLAQSPAAPATPEPPAAPAPAAFAATQATPTPPAAPKAPRATMIAQAAPAPAAEAPAPPEPPAQPQAAAATAGNPRGSFLAALVAAGYGNLSVDQIIDLKNAGVSGEFLMGISQAGWGKPSPDELINLCHHGVNPAYIRKMREAGFKDLTLKDVIQLSEHGVRPERVQEIHSLGFGPYTTRQIIDFCDAGIQPDTFRALKESGFGSADPQDIREAALAGLRARDLREARQYGSSLTLKQVIKLKMAGVI